MGYGSGPYGSGPYGSGSGAVIFEPPTYELHISQASTHGARMKIDQGISIVRIGGVLRLVRSPSPTQLEAAGTEGVDYFIGGHRYQVSGDVLAELQLGGFA